MSAEKSRDVGNVGRMPVAEPLAGDSPIANSAAPDSCDAADRVDALAEEFIARYRRGETPAVDEYVARHPELAGDIVQLFPAILVLEKARPADANSPGDELPSRVVPDTLGAYRLIRPIGRGGMGLVYEAEHQPLGRRVALKVLPPEIEPESQRRVRFDRESRAAALLHHSNIVPVFDVGQHDGWCYYAMQLVAGVALDEVIRTLREFRQVGDGESSVSSLALDTPAARLAFSLRTGRWTPADSSSMSSRDPVTDASTSQGPTSEPDLPYWHGVARLGVQVASALQHAHEHGVLHRDIKPGNLLLDEFGAVWVADFGLVKFAAQDDLTKTGEWLGTLRYLPPEVFENVYDARGDLYSLGLTLYELVALEPALGQSTKSQLVAHLVRDEPARLEHVRPTVPRDLATIIHKAIEPDPARRYASAAELADDLRRYLADRPIHARPVSRVERLTRWSRRNRGLAASMAGLAASLLLFGAGAMVAALTYHRIAHENQRLVVHERLLSRQVSAERDSKQIALAEMYANFGLEQSEQKHQREALLWFVQAAETSAMDSHQRRVNETRMAAWYHQLSQPFCRIPNDGGLEQWCFHPNDRYLLGQSIRRGKRPMIWDLETRRLLELPESRGPVTSLTWSADGSRLAVGNAAGRVTICHFPSLETIETLEINRATSDDKPQPVTRLAFSPDGARLAIADDRSFRIWHGSRPADLSVATACTKRPVDLLFSPGGRHLLITDDNGGVSAFAVDSLFESADSSNDDSQPRTIGGVAAWTAQLDWSADWVQCLPQFDEEGGNAIIAGPNGRITWIRLDDGHVTREVTHRAGRHAPPYEVKTNPSRTRFAVASHECGVDIYSTADGSLLGSLPERGDMTVCFTSAGDRLHAGGANREAKTWTLDGLFDTGSPAVHPTGFLRLVCSHDDRYLVAVSYTRGACVWRLPEPAERRLPGKQQPAHYRCWFSQDSKFVFVRQRDAALSVHDVATGRQEGERIETNGHLLEAQTSPDDRTICLLAALDDGTFQVTCRDWRTGSSRFPPVRLVGELVHGMNTGWYLSDELQFAPDGDTAYVLVRGLLTRLDAHSGVVQWQQKLSDSTERFRLSQDGRWIVCSGGPHIEVLDASRGEPRQQIPAHALSVAISPDSQWIAYGGQDGNVRFWSFDSRTKDEGYLAHPSWVESIEFSSDGRRLLTCCKDHGIRIWERATGRLVGTPLLLDEPCAAVLTTDGRFIATASASGMISLHDVRDGKRVIPTVHVPSPFQNQVFNGARNLRVSRDERWLAVGGRAFDASLFRLDLKRPDFPHELTVQRRWAEVLSYSGLNSQAHLVPLTESEWESRWRALEASRAAFVGATR